MWYLSLKVNVKLLIDNLKAKIYIFSMVREVIVRVLLRLKTDYCTSSCSPEYSL